MKSCPRHGLWTPPPPRCPGCNRLDSARRRKKWQHQIWTSPEWKRVRAGVLARDGYRCVYCGRRDKLQAHHLDPISESDPSTWYDASRIVTACAHCHGPRDGGRSRNVSPQPQTSSPDDPPAPLIA